MPTRRALLKSAGAAAAVAALAPRVARAQGRKPVLTIALPSTPETIDPHQFRSVLSGSIINLMGEGLLTRDPYSMELKPVLAESWRNVNPTTWEFKHRRGVKFHNNEDFNADCVKFTVERIVKSKLNTLGKLTWPPAFGQDVQVQLAIPTILLAIAVTGVLGPGLTNVILTLTVTGWTFYARLIRGETLAVKERDYVLAARAAGAGDLRIMGRHVVPNVLSPVIVVAVFAVANMIILEATLSFLGLGVEPQVVTWGRMLNAGRLYLGTAWWLMTFPGLAIFVTVLSVNLVGDHLRDWLDPRLRGSLGGGQF